LIDCDEVSFNTGRYILDWSQFSLIIRPLFESFNNSASSVGSSEELSRSVLAWLRQHCSLVALRPGLFRLTLFIITIVHMVHIK